MISVRNKGEILVNVKKATERNLREDGDYFLDIKCPESYGEYVDYLGRLCEALPDLRNWRVEMANQTEISNGLLRIFFVLHQISE